MNNIQEKDWAEDDGWGCHSGMRSNPYGDDEPSGGEATTISYTIDRFEGDAAVLEDPETLETKNVPRSALPTGAKEGDVLTVDGAGEWRINEPETAARAAQVRARFERLRKRE